MVYLFLNKMLIRSLAVQKTQIAIWIVSCHCILIYRGSISKNPPKKTTKKPKHKYCITN